MNSSTREIDAMLLSNRSSRLNYASVAYYWFAAVAIAASVSGARPAAAQVMEQLPPPPNVTFGETLPTATPVPYRSSSAASSRATAAQDAYLVFVNGDSPLMLQQVRAVVPSADYREHEGRTVIEAGVFQQQNDANQQIAQLESRGIGAGLDRVELAASGSSVNAFAGTGGSAPREVEFGQPTVAVTPSSGLPILVNQPASSRQTDEADADDAANYFVVVPSNGGNVEAISQYVAQLALDAPASGVQVGRHLGSHVRVGPFRDRSTAQNWENYLRAFGMDARVHYRR